MHTPLKSIVADNWDYLGTRKVEGGSCFNTGCATLVSAEALLGKRAAKQINIDHIPASNVTDALTFNMPIVEGSKTREKSLYKNPTPRPVVFSQEQIESLTKCNVFFYPLSTPNAYPAQLDQALKIIRDENENHVEIIATFHGFNAEKSPVKHWPGMDAATIWVGNSKEIGAPQNADKRASFLDRGDTLTVETRGENGVVLSTKEYKGDKSRAYSAVPVQELFKVDIKDTGTIGCGNGVEGATILHALGLSKGSDKTAKLDWFGASANATAGAVASFMGSTLTSEHVPLIKKGFKYLTSTPR
jgi:sugar/nucleoside kinase (ribokinase family)